MNKLLKFENFKKLYEFVEIGNISTKISEIEYDPEIGFYDYKSSKGCIIDSDIKENGLYRDFIVGFYYYITKYEGYYYLIKLDYNDSSKDKELYKLFQKFGNYKKCFEIMAF